MDIGRSVSYSDDTGSQSPSYPGSEGPETMAETLVLKGTLRGTAIRTPIEDSDRIVSSAGDKRALVWPVTLTEESPIAVAAAVHGIPRLCLSGHFNLVKDVILSSDGKLALSGHSGHVNTIAISPDGDLLATGGEDCALLLWDISDEGKFITSLECGAIIHAICIRPTRKWLCVATEDSIEIWDIWRTCIVQELKLDTPTTMNQKVYCTRMSWSSDGNTLITCYTDDTIKFWGISHL